MISAQTLHLSACQPQAELPPFWRLGVLSECTLPLLWPVSYDRGLVVSCSLRTLPQAVRLLENCLLQLLLQAEPGRFRVTVYESGLQQNLSHLDNLRLQTRDRGLQLLADRRALKEQVQALLQKARQRKALLAQHQLEDWQELQAQGRAAEPIEILVINQVWADIELLQQLADLSRSGVQLGILPLLVLCGKDLLHELAATQQASISEAIDYLLQGALVCELHGEGVLSVQQPGLEAINELYQDFMPQVDAYDEPVYRQVVQELASRQQVSQTTSGQDDFLRVAIGWESGRRFYFSLGAASHVHHGLIAGTTQSGKTTLINQLVAGICQNYTAEQIQVFLFDYKDGVSFSIFEDLPQVAQVHANPHDAAPLLQCLERCRDEIEQRARLFRACGRGITSIATYNQKAEQPLPRWLLIVDDIQSALDSQELGTALRERIREVATRGAAFGLHLLFACQSYQDVELDEATRAQMRLRIAFRLANTSECQAFFGRDNLAPLSLSAFHCIYNPQDGDPQANHVLQVDYLPEVPDLDQAMEAVRCQQAAL